MDARTNLEDIKMNFFNRQKILPNLALANFLLATQAMAESDIAVNYLANNSLAANLNIETLIVQGYRVNLLGETLSASEGIIGSEEIANRPLLRTGEILEFIPGMVVTQHSGSGKANQYFLRGFNLDHGTDFNTSIDGMPVNMRTHGHGQGYTDLNFIIPEFIQSINYHKGPYYADVGDFSGAGAAAFNLKNKLGEQLISITAGENNYARMLVGGDIALTNGKLLLGYEHQGYDGPWSMINEDVQKNNLLGRYTSHLGDGDLAITFMAYQNRWNSADQIPERAVQQKIIDALGSLDTSLGGESKRYSLSASWHSEQWSAHAYGIHSALDLFSNFTYFLDDPINGDQFEQVDERNIFGGELSKKWSSEFAGKAIDYTFGGQVRYDAIGEVALYHTRERERLNTTRKDAVDEASLGLFSQASLVVSENLKLNLGARYDFYRAQVSSNIAQNSGTADDGLFSLKAGATYTFSERLEGYINAGQGLHSNDARGATITQDPVTGEATSAVNLLVPSRGAEIGLKLFDAKRFNISTSLWYLRSESELVFVGDAGNTEASRASERYGNEIAAYYWLDNGLSFDVELAWTRAHFTENVTQEGKYVEGSVPFVASAGISYGSNAQGMHGSLRYRYFGARRLDSFNQQQAQATQTLNFGVGYSWKKIALELSVLNLANSRDHDIDYFYSSRLPGESAEASEDLHYHPLEPRTLRLKADYKF
jgi:outer membrane receptor protein involved in Fe transport